jgi:hypothetical protein
MISKLLHTRIRKYVNRSSFCQFFLVFLTSFLIYTGLFNIFYLSGINTKPLQSEDIISTAAIPFSILKEQNLDVNEYYDLMTKHYPNPDNKENVPYYLKKVQDKYYSFFPNFTAILATPVYIIPALLNWDDSIETFRIMSRLGGAFITSLSVAFFWLLLRVKMLNLKLSIVLIIVYAFATNSLSTSSQGLWQHGSSQLFLTIGLLSLIKQKYNLSGLALGFAFISRPTNLLPLVIFGVYTLFKTKNIKQTVLYTLYALIPILLEVIIEIKTYGNVLNSGYATHTQHFTHNMIEGFLGMWFSPSKGILIVSPVLIFMFYGFYKAIRKHKLNDLNLYLTGIIIVHFAVLGTWYNWFGGFSWGNRMSSDIIPIMVFMLIPFVSSKHFKRYIYLAIFTITLLFSIFYHLMGLIYFDGVWHTIYDSKTRFWLWTIKDSQLVFSVKRAMFKLGVISNPIPEMFIPK